MHGGTLRSVIETNANLSKTLRQVLASTGGVLELFNIKKIPPSLFLLIKKSE